MKLEEGMYVRTKKGKIAKIISKEDVSSSLHREEIVFILDIGDRLAIHSKKVTKASENIIDLIEVGDYVNGYRVTLICEDECHQQHKCLRLLGHSYIWQKNIKSIVTKEQFESMAYEVEEC